MVVRLFDQDEVYTNEGNDLELEIHNALKPILDKCRANNYAMRDVDYIISSHVACECSIGILFRNLERRRKVNGAAIT